MSATIKKIIIIIIYLCILIMIPLFLDYLFNLTIRKRRAEQTKSLAQQTALDKGKALVIFEGIDSGTVIDGTAEKFTGNITEIANQMADNSCVVLVIFTLEYVDNIEGLLEQLKKISGGDLYAVNIEKNAPRIFWDYRIKNIMDKSYYLPDDSEIKWASPNGIQKKIKDIYSYIFKIVPYDFFTTNVSLDEQKKFEK